MQCRHFTIRLSPTHFQEDEDRLNAFLSQVTVHSIQTSPDTSQGGRWSILVFYQSPGQGRRATGREDAPPAAPAAPPAELSVAQGRIFEQLCRWRRARAQAEGKPPYLIASNAVLAEIARSHMTLQVAEDLERVRGVGQRRASRYGQEIIAVLHSKGEAEEGDLFAEDLLS